MTGRAAPAAPPRRAAHATALLLALLLPGPLAAQDTVLVDLLVDVRIENGPAEIMFALVRDTTLFLAARPFLTLAEVRMAPAPPGRLVGDLQPDARRFVVAADSGYLEVDGVRTMLASGQAVVRGEDLYLETGVLTRLLDVGFRVNLAELTVQVRQTEGLPVVGRLARARRRERLTAARAAPPPVPLDPERRPLDGAVLDWSATSLTEDPLNASALRVGLGAQVLGGSAVLEHQERRTVTGGARETRGSWIRAWHTTPVIRQLRLGDVLGTGRAPRLVRGAAVTNAPFLRPAEFGVQPLYGTFGPGWEVELYRNEQLVDYTAVRPDGGFAFDVPVRYGQNPVDVVAYGPHGEVVRLERTFEIAPVRLPGGQFEYGVAGGTCGTDPCEALLNADLRYGVHDRLTAGLGADRFWRDTLPDLWHPYASLSGQPTRSVALTVEAVGYALVTGRVDVAPTPDLQAAATHTRFATGTVQPLVGSSFERHRSDLFVFFRPGILSDQFFLRLTAFQAAGPGRRREQVRLVATTRFLGTRVDLGTRVERLAVAGQPTDASTGLEARFFHLYTGPERWLRRTLVFGELDANLDSGLTRARFAVSRAFADRFQIDAGVDWQRGVPGGVAFELGLTATLPAVRAVSRNRFAADGTRGTQVAEGSVLWDRERGALGVSDGRALGRAGLSGDVFLDDDGDGVRDPGEPPLAGIRLQIGPRTVTTDAQGRFAAWDLVPFEPLVVEVDTLSVRDPLEVPAAARFVFRPDPNTFTPVPIPFVRAGEVSGRVLLEGAGVGLGGAGVVLENRSTGDRYATRTYSDGGFYVLGVRPGEYTVTVDAETLERLGAVAAPARFTVGRGREEAIVEGIEVRVRR